jgi:hypothetical protein
VKQEPPTEDQGSAGRACVDWCQAVRLECCAALRNLEDFVRKNTGQKKQKCKNCEGKGALKKGDKIVRCRRCGGTGIKP